MADLEPLDPKMQAVVDDESALLERVKTELYAAQAKGVLRHGDADKEIIALRDQLAETRAEDHAMLVEHMTRLAALRATTGRERELAADPNTPYFARIRLDDIKDEKARRRDVLIGRRAYIDTRRGVQIVDWRNSPISRIYYCYREGDEYEEQFAKEVQTGTVAMRHTLTIQGGELRRIRAGEQTVLKTEDGWVAVDADRTRLQGGMGTAIRAPRERMGTQGGGGGGRLPEITALIDPEQFRIITEPDAGIVVIRGGAGTGKTTIALHRVAYLHFQDAQRFAAKRILIITPGEALKRYVARVLPALDVSGVPIQTFPQWALSTAKRMIPGLKKRKLTDETPVVVGRLKRHPAMLKLLENAVRAEGQAVEPVLLDAGGPALLDAWVRRRNAPTMQRLQGVHRWLKTEKGRVAVGDRLIQARKAMDRLKIELGDPVETWAELLTDRKRLLAGYAAAGDPQPASRIESLVEFVSRQIDDPEDLRSVDASHRTGIDGRSINDGELAGHLDVDDLALMLRVCQLKYGRMTGPSGQVATFEHIVVDEAQDLAPIAIQVLCALTRPGGPITLAGDTAQRLSLDSGFSDWDALQDLLKIKAKVLPPLAVAYRSTQEVMALARHVLGDLAPHAAPRDARSGAPVEFMQFDEMGEAVGFLADALKSLRDRERRASVALVARTPAIADAYYSGLRRAEVPVLRRIRHQEFDFTPGIDLTDIYQIKGLEYDYIVLLEPTEESYPGRDESRHLLHIGATRAAHQLWLICSGKPSPLLPRDLVKGT